MSSMSRSFNSKDAVNWQAKLREVHSRAWKDWQTSLSNKVGYRLKTADVQDPGVIADNVLVTLGEAVADLPPKTKYAKT